MESGKLMQTLVGLAMVMVLSVGNYAVEAQAQPQVPCFFILGDSLLDNGNNNGIAASLAKANYRPYGIDFPAGPTGRFSNGKTAVDVIAQLLGFNDYIPPYATTRGNALVKGVNYASAAAGIREETGRQLGGRITFTRQVQNYQSTASQLTNILGGEAAAADHLSKCIFVVGMGSNDYLNNYYMPQFYTSGSQYSPEQWADILIRLYVQQLRIMYNNGARKVALLGLGQIGCSPSELAQRSSNSSTCVQNINDAVQIFNNKLKSAVDDFNKNFANAKFTYINTYNIFQDLLTKPSSFGLKVIHTGCCGVGRNNGQITCLPNQRPCQHRKEYLFWDAFHPTEAVNTIFGRRSYRAESSADAYPIDIRQLAML